MATSGTVFAIVSSLAGSVSTACWEVETLPTPATPDPQPVPDHPALGLLRRPNPFMSGGDLIESCQQHFELTGESYLVVYRGARTRLPTELWPVRPDRMSPVPGSDGVFLAGWVYTGPDGERVPLDVQDVIQVRHPHPTDPYRGLGALQSVMVDIDSGRLAAEWNRNFFLNSAQPGGIIEVDEGLSDVEWRQMVARWGEQHQGVAQAHRVAILERGKWVDRNYSVKDMDFSSLRQIPDEKIRQAFAYPKPMLGAVDDINRANAVAGEYVFAKHLIERRLTRWQSAFNSRLLPMFGPLGEGVRFTYESPVPEDAEAENAELTAKTAAAATLVTAGWRADDVLSVVGLPPMTYEGRPSAPAPTADATASPAA
jgi:HK97 family phage portal protein